MSGAELHLCCPSCKVCSWAYPLRDDPYRAGMLVLPASNTSTHRFERVEVEEPPDGSFEAILRLAQEASSPDRPVAVPYSSPSGEVLLHPGLPCWRCGEPVEARPGAAPQNALFNLPDSGWDPDLDGVVRPLLVTLSPLEARALAYELVGAQVADAEWVEPDALDPELEGDLDRWVGGVHDIAETLPHALGLEAGAAPAGERTSLIRIDHALFEHARAGQSWHPAAREQMWRGLGCFLADCIARNLGGRWVPRADIAEAAIVVGRQAWLPWQRAKTLVESPVGRLSHTLSKFYAVVQRCALANQPPAIDVPAALERAVLELVLKGGSRASWHYVATRLPLCGVPLQPGAMDVLKELHARGYLEQGSAGGGMDRWWLTAEGSARLRRLTSPGVLSGGELAQLLDAMRSGVEASIRCLIPFADDGEAMSGVLRQVLEADLALAERVAFGAAMLPAGFRMDFAVEMLSHAVPEVRVALFRALTPARLDIPGQATPILSVEELDRLLARGLADPVLAVRAAAAALAFGADRGAALVEPLSASIESGSVELAFWACLSLGAARDSRSLSTLIDLADSRDPLLASAAVRALAARPDGRARWLAAINDLRTDVHHAAVFALAEIAVDLSDVDVATIARDGRPLVRTALAKYRARTQASS